MPAPHDRPYLPPRASLRLGAAIAAATVAAGLVAVVMWWPTSWTGWWTGLASGDSATGRPAATVSPLPVPRPTDEVRTAPPLPRTLPGASDGGRTVYKCVTPQGTRYGEVPACEGQLSVITADPQRNLIAGQRPAPAAVAGRVAQPAEAAPGALSLGTPPQSAAGSGHQLECNALATEILAIDAAARQGQSAAGQDRLRQQRHAARQRQSALNCR